MISQAKAILKSSPLYPILLPIVVRARQVRQESLWHWKGRPVPPPSVVKRRLLKQTAKRLGLRFFVETGTFQGETIAALLGSFEHLYTVELFEPLFDAAARRFASESRVTILQGNSADRLPEIVARLDAPALFWLDAHDSGPGTGAAEMDPPATELAAIFASGLPHVIYIDDARTFTGLNGYPTLDELKALTYKHRSGWRCWVADDVIRIEP